MSAVARFRTGYFDLALDADSLAEILDAAVADLRGVDFDTLVGTGFSGSVVIPALAVRLGKNFVLIRKEEDGSHHGGGRLIGALGERWIFVDDFISSGATKRRVGEKVEAACVIEDHETTYVGDYLYHQRWDDSPAWRPAENEIPTVQARDLLPGDPMSDGSMVERVDNSADGHLTRVWIEGWGEEFPTFTFVATDKIRIRRERS